jgi:hypothetical protein
LSEPASMAEHSAKTIANSVVTGWGIDGVTNHTPCPFCAEPEWLVFRVIDTEEAIKRDTICQHCGRSAKALVRRDTSGVSFEIVQTGGADPPSWLTPAPRRMT